MKFLISAHAGLTAGILSAIASKVDDGRLTQTVTLGIGKLRLHGTVWKLV
jgi:hypothetical protein